MCAAYVNQVVDEVIDYIEQGMEELQICQLIGLCDGKAKPAARKK
jgi:hypothetical protein